MRAYIIRRLLLIIPTLFILSLIVFFSVRFIKVPSWGAMLSREGRQYMQQAPWLALWPGLAPTIVVYSLNMFGDAVRDLLDEGLKYYQMLRAVGVRGYSRTVNGLCNGGAFMFPQTLPEVYAATLRDI